jgi:hypothetical protein
MLTSFNSQERTAAHFRDLMQASGWKLVQLHYGAPYASGVSKAIGLPA